jgi:hypothetical protein
MCSRRDTTIFSMPEISATLVQIFLDERWRQWKVLGTNTGQVLKKIFVGVSTHCCISKDWNFQDFIFNLGTELRYVMASCPMQSAP